MGRVPELTDTLTVSGESAAVMDVIGLPLKSVYELWGYRMIKSATLEEEDPPTPELELEEEALIESEEEEEDPPTPELELEEEALIESEEEDSPTTELEDDEAPSLVLDSPELDSANSTGVSSKVPDTRQPDNAINARTTATPSKISFLRKPRTRHIFLSIS